MPPSSTRCSAWAGRVSTGRLRQHRAGVHEAARPCCCATWPKCASVRRRPQGATLRNGETVSGMVIMLKGENGKQLIERVKEKIASLRLPAGREDHAVLRPGVRHRRHDSHRREESVRRVRSGHRGVAAVPGQHARGADHGVRHPVLDADQFSRHAAVRHQREPDESRRDRLRHDRRRRGGDDGELRPSARRQHSGQETPLESVRQRARTKSRGR